MGDKIAIIGAGIAGISAARTLTDAGHDITVFEKSGGTGGRLSTRRTEFGDFDHGAQYITAKGAPFRALMTGLSNAGAAAFWEPQGKVSEKEWHVGTPGMSGIVKPLLAGFSVKKNTRIVEIKRDGSETVCFDDDGASERFDKVIVATPSPQAYDLLSPVDDVFSSLNSVVYMPCWTAMFAFGDPVGSLPDFYRGEDHEIISWLARNSAKPERSGVETMVAQAGAVWSKDNIALDRADALRLMQERLGEMAGGQVQPVHSAIHRWLYARVDKPLGTAFLGSADDRFFAIGDGMLGGRVEAAFESARQLCNYLKN